jgi:hypothetical protein
MNIRLRTKHLRKDNLVYNVAYYIDKNDILDLKVPIYVKKIIKDNLKLFSTIFDTNDTDVANLLCAQFNNRYDKFEITPMDSIYDLYSTIAHGVRCVNGKCVPIC